MAFTYRIAQDKAVLVLTYTGTFTLSDGIQSSTAMVKDPAFRPDLCQIVDLSGVTNYDISFPEMVHLVALKVSLYRTANPTFSYVLVAPGDTDFGMARMFQQVADERLTNLVIVARSEAEALASAGLKGVCTLAELFDAPGPKRLP